MPSFEKKFAAPDSNDFDQAADKTPVFEHKKHVLNLKKEEPSAKTENETAWRPQLNEKLLFLKTIKELDEDGRQISRKIIDSGWEVSHIKDNLVYLRKHESRGDITDFAPIDELEKLNHRGHVDFTKAENFIDLFELAKRNGGLRQGPASYSVDEIKTVINRLINEEIQPDEVTAANGFRQAVENILSKEATSAEGKQAGTSGGEENIPEKSLDEKISEIKNRIQNAENYEKEKLTDNPLANIRTDNPDDLPRASLDAMRHLDPETVGNAPKNYRGEKFDPETHEKEMREAYQENEAAKDREVAEKYQNNFGISAENLQTVEGFDKLSRGQKLFVLENLAQLALSDVKNEAKEEYAAGFKSLAGKDKKFLEKAGVLAENIWRGLSKSYQVAKLEKIKAQEIKQGGMKEYGELLKQLADGMQDCPDVVEKNGRLEMQFLQMGSGSEVVGMAQKYNDAANEFMRLPKEWSYEDAKPGQKKIFAATKLRYEETRDEALNAMKENFGEMNACLNMNNTEAKIYLNQFLNQNPEAEKEIINLGNQKNIVRAFKDFGKGRRLSFAAGFAIRSLTTSVVGAVAAPIAGGVIGGWQARIRAKEGLTEKDRASRRGILDKSAEAKNFVAAEDLESKLDTLIIDWDKKDLTPENKAFFAKDAERLQARINYTQRKIDSGLTIFGRDEEALAHQYRLIQKLSQAKAKLEIATPGTKMEDLNLSQRLDKFLEFKKQNIGAKRADLINKKMWQGAARGACFSSAGWVTRHLAGEWFHWKTSPLLANNIKKIFGEAEAAELPQLPTAGEVAVRNVILNRVDEFVPPAPSEHLAEAVHSGLEINPDGYQGGHSIWQEGAKQLEHHYDNFKHLNKNLQNFDINRLKNAVAADPEKFGLPKNVDINKVTADDLKNVRWNEAMREIFGNQKNLGEKINNLHEVLSQHGKHVIPFKGRGAPLPEKIAPSREILPEHPAENILKQNNVPADDSFAKVAQDIKNAAPTVPEQAPAITGPSWHRPSLGYQNIQHTPPAENFAAAAIPAEPSGMHLHETILENPNVGPDYAVIKPEEHFVDFRAAERLAKQPGNLDLHNVKAISSEALDALQNKTDGAIYLNGLDPEKITDNNILQSLSELRKNVHVVLRDSVARQVDNWETNAGEYQQDWSVDSQHVPAAPDWHVDDQHVPTAEPPPMPVAENHLAAASTPEDLKKN